MDHKFCIIMTSVPVKKMGTTIAKLILQKKLAACIQVFPISSMYTWKGEMVEDSEFMLYIKTQSIFFDQIQECIVENHPYDVPEIIQTPITHGSGSYLDWMTEVTME